MVDNVVRISTAVYRRDGWCWWPGCKSQDLRSKGNGMARAHLQEQWKKVAPPTNNTALTLTDLQTD